MIYSQFFCKKDSHKSLSYHDVQHLDFSDKQQLQDYCETYLEWCGPEWAKPALYLWLQWFVYEATIYKSIHFERDMCHEGV